jgi:hypothetical protein
MNRAPAIFRRLIGRIAASILVVGLCARCDTVEPTSGPLLVVEGFFDAGQPLPTLVLRRTGPLSAPYADGPTTAITDGRVDVVLAGRYVPYRHNDARAGRYEPAESTDLAVSERAPFHVRVEWGDQSATADGTVPPPIAVDSIRISAPDAPVQAVDSLRLDAIGTEFVFIYPVEVQLWWSTNFAETGPDSLYWIRAQLKPFTSFSSALLDLFLRRQQIFRETSIARDDRGVRRWTGVYAVPVDRETDPLPAHDLKISLLRSGEDYARFASSRDDPERREPVSNVRGGVGIVAGVAVDSLRLRVEEGTRVVRESRSVWADR